MTGSIEKRGKDSYRLVVFKGYDLDGKAIRHQKTVHCKNKSEARTELAKYIAEVENGFIVEGNVPTFKEFVEIWKRDYGLKELAPSTYYRYLGILESRILPYFGHFKLNKIRPIDIMQFYNLLDEDTQIIRKKNNNGKKTRKPLSKKTILEHHRLLHAMLTKAVYWQMIVNNPAERVQPPKAPKPKRDCYDEVQTRILIDNLEKLTTVYPAEKDYLSDLIEVIKSYDDLSDGELKYLANLPVRMDNAAELVTDIKERIPVHYIIQIKQRVESIDAQTEIIMFTEDLRYDNN